MSVAIVYADTSLTLTLNGHMFNDFASGDAVVLAPVNEKTTRVNGANNTVSIANRFDSNVYNMTINLIENSDDDIYLSRQLNSEYPVIFDGSLKENYRKDGEIRLSNARLEAGSFTTLPTMTKNSQDGSRVRSYALQFRKVTYSN